MNHPKATRLRLCLAIAVVAAFAVVAPSMASAAISTEASTVYGAGAGPGTHTDYTIIQNFQYGNGVEPAATTAPGQDLKKWIVDSPAGLVGNPNAIPQDKRCEPSSFDPTPAPYAALNTFWTGSCPASSQVGEAKVYLVNDADSGACPAAPIACVSAGFPMENLSGGVPMLGKIYILKTDPEIPTTLGTIFTSAAYQNYDFTVLPGAGPNATACTTAPATPCAIQPKTKSVLAPSTNLSSLNNGATDFRIRTIPAEYSNPPSAILPSPPHAAFAPLAGSPTYGTPVHIRRIDQKLYGQADPNDNFPTPGQGDSPFLTMPHTCSDWNSFSYAISWGADNGSLAMDPNHPSDNKYVVSNTDAYTPDCSNRPNLNASATAVLSDHNRDAHPALSTSVKNADVVNGDNPSKVVVTLPGATTIDVQNIGNACTTAQRDAAACPDAALVGSATISTPLVSAGLTGKVYIVKNESKPSLPDLAIFVDGAIKFRLDGTTKFVGTDSAQIETTFAGLPDAPFSDFTVNINGGPTGLLQNRSCPTNGSAPLDGATTVSINGFAGGATSNSTANNYPPCYGTPKVTKKNSCTKVNKKFSAKPSGYVDVPSIQKVQIQTSTKSKSNFHTRQTDKKTPYSFKFTLKKGKFKANKKYYYRVRVAYNDGKVIYSKSTTFKTCK